MRVAIIGSGGREHALAWKISQSPRLSKLFVVPGNAGTATHNRSVRLTDHAEVGHFASDHQLDLVIIGPEAPLADGLADSLRAAGFTVFGPSQAAAEIESSKAFAKAFMARHGIPTARFATYSNYESALSGLHSTVYPVVIKASGLAAGKGVLLPATMAEAEAALRGIMLNRDFGAAGDEVVIEERLTGPEVSLLAFSDSETISVMPPAQDHKRLLDGDVGPNTGGMGAYAPAPICPPELAQKLARTTLQPVVDGLRQEGRPFVGVLYAGLMLTAAGPAVLEYNCRFGDPETQVILPLLDSDLLTIAEACANGRLGETEVKWKNAAAACVVMASQGYPAAYATGREITGLETEFDDAVVFHAGTAQKDGRTVTAGGRVLAVTGWGDSIEEALHKAYVAVGQVKFEGAQWRKDIGWRAKTGISGQQSSYAASGVNIEAGNRAVDLMREAVKSTYGPEVLAAIGSFGGLFSAAALKEMKDPVLVASTDGVGTKVKLAAQAGRYETIGQDIVNHCINDILVQGASPLFFMDYIASSKLNPEMVARVVTGMAEACRAAGCALLGGETAEMPGVYQSGEFDVAGTIVGVVERGNLLPRGNLQAGDVLIGLRSSGPHTNGYSLIRKVFQDVSLDTVFAELGVPLADALLAPHRSYLSTLGPNLGCVKALAHLTGGGFIENIPRVLPETLGAAIRLGSWPVPPLFTLIQQRGGVEAKEMYRVFNMGIGLVAIVARQQAEEFRASISEETFLIGELTPGPRGVALT